MEQNQVIPVDIAKMQFLGTRASAPKVADRKSGAQKVDPRSGLPMWTTELTAISASGARVMQVTTASQFAPEIAVGEFVVPVGLEALPWENVDREGKTRSGIAYRATELRPASVPAGVAA
jgi:hypothetical protein